jgi:L-2-hydroxyglutarate oxidase LhgO
MTMYDFALIGGGIVGLSTGMALMERFPEARIVIMEKESTWARHQTGNNSGVIHSGIYYKPGSLKARFATAGSRSMVDFCRQHQIDYDICGKVIVATTEKERSYLNDLYERGLQNGLNLKKIGPDELHTIEPHVSGIEAIHVPTAGIVNYRQVCQTFVSLLEAKGHELCLSTKVEQFSEQEDGVRTTHVCNAPSPAATASIEIGQAIVEQLAEKIEATEERHISMNTVHNQTSNTEQKAVQGETGTKQQDKAVHNADSEVHHPSV